VAESLEWAWAVHLVRPGPDQPAAEASEPEWGSAVHQVRRAADQPAQAAEALGVEAPEVEVPEVGALGVEAPEVGALGVGVLVAAEAEYQVVQVVAQAECRADPAVQADSQQ